MTGSLLFVLPDGRQAQVSMQAAQQICERLWGFGVMPGAVTAAVRISDAVQTSHWYGGDVAFTDREVAPLLEASDHNNPLTWSGTGPAAARQTIPAELRQQLLVKCGELIATLDTLGYQLKLRALIADLERLRDSLR